MKKNVFYRSYFSLEITIIYSNFENNNDERIHVTTKQYFDLNK